ncbi:tRNA lysidine(34) synthetase TilS [Pseudoduganella albidiflava]|uniref:tRNA(Ile)-lysidine synthase n=1 Tax=Pseudoduganella albidiflava TaxID=321983 RepID=A0A411X0G9_9BURK|nr:tRNA lysidine(34) synthetase TilS [Pseudoduganella albidiflava]QBI02428.1 tRNA lysidine(34) synthetase TilS [Pseudoduganella albidiflava]GGY42920.1 tRNA(Ile)-lysidine synthase [Pseudoduganella albidiflava]
MKSRHTSLPQVFAGEVSRLPREAGQPIAIAYSGGLDSSVLLHLARATVDGAPLFAFHIHHGLSPSADAWEAHCAAECEKLGITFAARRVTLADRKSGTEASARQARYAALGELCREHGVALLLTAHHLDDQAETILLQLARGAGPAGLSGMDAFNTAPGLLGSADILLARPLLEASRAQLEAHASAHGIAHIDDESNSDTRYARNALRHTVMPALAVAFPGYQERFARSAAHARSAQRLLTELAEQDLQAGLAEGSIAVDHLRALGEDRRNNLLRHWFGVRGIRIPSAAWLAEMIAQLLEARDGAELLVTHPDCEVRRHRGRVHLVPKPKELAGAEEDEYDERPVQHFRWNGEASIAFPDYGGTLHFEPAEEGIAADWLQQQQLTISFRRGGERVKLAPNRPTRGLKQHHQSLGTPAWERSRLPVVGIPGRLLYAAGIGMDCHYVATDANFRVALRWQAE